MIRDVSIRIECKMMNVSIKLGGTNILMSEEPKEKQIFFVSWKQHKLDLAKSHVDDITTDLMDDVIFETVIDFCRKEAGFPASLPLKDITANEPVIPNSPKLVDQPIFGPSQVERSSQTCPVCQTPIDARLFTTHLEKCIKSSGKNPLEIAIQIALKDT